MPSRTTRAPLAALVTAAALVLTACGGTGSDDQPDAAASFPGGAEEGAFPVTIEHTFGETTIEQEPSRVVTVGLKEQDDLLALGVVPVATSTWLDETPGAIYPWAEDLLGDAETPTLIDNLSDGIQFEQIAAEQPDLIIAVYSGLTQEEYDTLSAIAPVVAQPGDVPSYGISWQDELTTVGQAVGRPQAAEDLVAETESTIERYAADNPELAGQTAAVAASFEGVYVYGPTDPRTRLMTDLGMVFPDELAAQLPDAFGGNISAERVDLLDLDALVWLADVGDEQDAVASNGAYAALPVATEGRAFYVPSSDDYGNAFSFVTALSLPFIYERLVPQLVAATDGDPATEVPSS